MTLAEELAKSGILRKYLEAVIADGRSITFAKEHVETLLGSFDLDIELAIQLERERCCKAVCEWCAKGNVPSLIEGRYRHEYMEGSLLYFCLASAIRGKE